MNPLYEKAKDVVLIRRTSDNKEFEEYPLTVYPVSAIVTDPSNDIQCVSICSLSVGHANSASYVESASFTLSSSAALYAISSSYANSSSYTLFSSYASTSSLALVAETALSSALAGNAESASHALNADYAISASNAFSASYAQSASYGTNFYAPRVTSSVVSASTGMFTNLTVAGTMIGTSSYAVNALTAQNAANATNASTATLALNALTASVATSSFTASLADRALTADSVTGTITFAERAYTSNTTTQSLHATQSAYATSSIYADTASYAAWAAQASESLFTRGLNVVNLPTFPNADIQFSVADGHPAALAATASVPDAHTHATITLNNKLYGGGWDGWLWVASDPDGNLSDITSSWCKAGTGISQVAYSAGTGYLYFINGATPTGSIIKVDPNDITNQTVLVTGLPGYPSLPGLAADDNYLYTIMSSVIYKYDINTGALIGASASFGDSHGGGKFAPGTPYVFFCGGRRVTRVNTASLANDGVACYFQIHTASFVDDMAYLNGKVYVQHDASIGGYAGAIWWVDVNTLETGSWNGTGGYPMDYGGWGVWSDGQHVYTLQPSSNELWMYLNGNLDEGPVRFTICDSPNELWITEGGRYVVHDFSAGKIYAYYLPLTQLGINKHPSYTLDVAGTINAVHQIQSPTISASSTLVFGAATQTGQLTWNGGSTLAASPGNFGRLLMNTASIRVPTISASFALLGHAVNNRMSQSFGFGTPLAVTRSMGNIRQDGMYRLTWASTVGFYSGSTVTALPSWSFKHTDRLGTYNLPPVPPVPYTIAAPAYEAAYMYSGDYVFQGVNGTPVEYYWYGPDLSSTPCSASFFTTATLTQILSGSVTSSIP